MKSLPLFIIFLASVIFVACEEKEENPSITTDYIRAISAKRYYVKALVPSKGNIPVTDHGFAYYIGNTNSQYGGELKVSLGKTIEADTFSTDIILNSLTGYYQSSGLKLIVRAYITNEKGTMYAKPISTDLLLSQVSQVVPNYGKAGDTITIKGNNFDPVITNNSVFFNNTPAKVIEATINTLKVTVPSSISTSYYDSYVTLKVVNGNLTSDYTTNFSLSPSATNFSPTHGTWGTNVIIYGNNLYNCNVYLNDIKYSTYNSQSNSISISIPSSVYYKSFKLYVEKNGQKIEVPGGVFKMDSPMVTSVSPQKCLPGSNIVLNVVNYSPSYEFNKLHIGNQVISSSNYYNGNVTFPIPASVPKGVYTAFYSNKLDTVKVPGTIEVVHPEITGISPSTGYINTKYTITGKNLYNGYSSTYVYFDNYSVSANVTDSNTVKGNVPGLEPDTYTVSINIGNLKITSPTKFTILAPKLTAISPSSGAANSSVIISGEGFGTSLYNCYVYFGNLSATPMSLTDSEINVKVPSGVTSGKWMVKVIINGYTIPTSLTFDVP